VKNSATIPAKRPRKISRPSALLGFDRGLERWENTPPLAHAENCAQENAAQAEPHLGYDQADPLQQRLLINLYTMAEDLDRRRDREAKEAKQQPPRVRVLAVRGCGSRKPPQHAVSSTAPSHLAPSTLHESTHPLCA
jgi:hypothetical protein